MVTQDFFFIWQRVRSSAPFITTMFSIIRAPQLNIFLEISASVFLHTWWYPVSYFRVVSAVPVPTWTNVRYLPSTD